MKTIYENAGHISEVYNNIISSVSPKGKILSVGDSTKPHAMLNKNYFLSNLDEMDEMVGINIDKSHCGIFGHFEIKYCNAHNICYGDNYFDCIINVMVLEHDPEFWLTIDEMYRVLKPGGSLIIAVPGFVNDSQYNLKSDKYHAGNGTVTYENHGDPDCYRFSPHFFEYVALKGCNSKQLYIAKSPPRLIGVGYKKQ